MILVYTTHPAHLEDHKLASSCGTALERQETTSKNGTGGTHLGFKGFVTGSASVHLLSLRSVLRTSPVLKRSKLFLGIIS